MPSGFEPLVVDNGSRDGSSEVARIVRREGHARAPARLRRGLLRRATSRARPTSSASWTATARSIRVNCTGSPTPWSVGGADLCLGARIPEPGAWPWHARLANRALAFELRRRTGAELTDLGPMRAARREPLLRLEAPGPRLGLAARDGATSRCRAMADRRGWSDLPAARRWPLKGQRQHPRDGARSPRHGRPAFITCRPPRARERGMYVPLILGYIPPAAGGPWARSPAWRDTKPTLPSSWRRRYRREPSAGIAARSCFAGAIAKRNRGVTGLPDRTSTESTPQRAMDCSVCAGGVMSTPRRHPAPLGVKQPGPAALNARA